MRIAKCTALIAASGIVALASAAPAQANLIGMTLTGQLTTLPSSSTSIATQFSPVAVTIKPGADFSGAFQNFDFGQQIFDVALNFSASGFSFAVAGAQQANIRGPVFGGFTLSGFSPAVTNITESGYTCTGNFACPGEPSGLSSLSFAKSALAVDLSNLATGQTYTFAVQQASQPVPEPASIALLGTGLLGIGFILRRKRQS